MERRYYVYILANRRRGVLYVGFTSDLSRRVTIHKQKVLHGFTRTYGVTLLVYFEEYSSVVEARARERVVKRWRRDWKLKLIERLNPDWRDLSNELAD